MASGPPANARVNSSRTTRITAARPPEINSGQRICNGTAEQIRARPSPALIRQTSVTQSTASTRNLPHTSLPLARRPAQSNAPAGTSRSTYNSPIDLQSVSRLPSASTPVQSLSTRSSTLASPSRIARPRAVSAASPTTPIGLPSRVRTMSSINPPTKYHLGSPVTSTKILNTNSVSGVVPKSSTSPTSSPRPAPKSRPATSPIVKSRATLAPSIPLKRSTRRDAAVSGRELKSEAGAESKIQSAKSIQNTESKNADPNAPEVTDSANLSSEDVDMLESVWKDSPVNTGVSFDPGGSSTIIDRAAVKSEYGSVFGFNMVPKLRNSVAVTEGSSGNRSQSTSSIGSTLSHFSVVSTKTVSAGLLYPDNPPRSQTVLQSPPFINLQTPPPSDDTAPVSPVTQQLPSKSSMLHPSVAPPSQLPSLSLDPLDVYTANQYLSTTPSMSTLGAWSNVPHGNSDTISSRPSGSMSRVYLPPTAHSKPKSIPSSHVNPSTRVSPESSRATSKCSFPQQAREGNLLVASRIAISSEYPPTPLHTEGPVVHRVTSPSVKSTVYAQPAELSNTVDAMSFASEDNLPQSSLSSTGPSYGQRYAFNTRPISSNISPSSPFSLPVDLSGPNAHSHSPLGSSPTHPPTVNLKRLLSKPAPAGNSSASESEGVVTTIDSRAVRRIERIEEKHEKQRIESSSRERTLESDAECAPNFVSSRERDRTRKTEWEAERRMLKERTSSHRRPTTSQSTDSSQTKERTRFGGLVRSASWSRSREREGTGQTGKKTKNVLKRRPSATSVASPLDASTMKEFPYSSFAPAYTGSIIHATQQMTSSGNLMPPSAGQSSSRSSSPAPQNKRRSFIPHSALLKQGLVSDDDASTLSGTTPAKEIMLAYKQQQERERNREKERNERAREKQRERDLWQQEEKERQQRGSEDRVSLSVPRNDGSIPSAKSSSSKNPPLAGVEHQSSASAPNLGAASVINDSSLSTNQLPSRPERIASEVDSFDEEPSQPYYTVLGSSRRIVAAEAIKIEDSFFPDFSWSTSNLVEGISSSMGVGLGLTQPSGSPQNEVSRPSTQTWTRSASVTASKPPTKTSSVFGIGKTLSRKMSGRLGVPKRAPSFDVGPVTSAPAILVQEHARTSLHERRAMPKKVSETSGSRGDAPNLQLSMDNRATPKGSLPPPKISPTLHRPSPTQDGEIHTPLLKTSLISSPQPSPTSATSHSGSKNKIWNLMKRISTGGLRDNYRDNGAGIPTSPLPPPPPVPALPKDLVMYPTEMVRKARADVTEMLHKRNDTSTTIQSPNGKHSSPGSIRPPTTPARMNVPLETPTSSTRPGTATRSSSPISSSDIGSSRFFNRTQSQRSSTSSYGDQIPPVPTAPGVRLQQHILPPSELYQLHLNLERSKDESQTRAMASSKSTNYSHSLSSLNTTPSISHSRSQVNLKLQTQAKSAPTEDWMIVPTPMEEKSGFSLPVPRRQKGSDNIEEAILRRPPLAYDNRRITSTDEVTRSSTGTASRQAKISGSPVAYGAPNAYSTASGVSGGNVGSRLSSPAIPLKSPRRVASASSASSTWSGRISSPTMPPLPATSSAVSAGGHQKLPEAHMKSDAESSRRAMRKSLGFGIPSEKTPINFVRKRTHSNSSRPRTSPAAHISSTTPSRLPQSETSQHPRSHTFGVLSDKEKDDKWDDLLERSKRAGGTLHVNGGLKGLDSDRLQFSVNDSGDELDEL